MTPDRNPLQGVAATVTKVVGVVSAALTALVGWGVVTAAQDDAVIGLLGTIPGVITMAGTAIAAFQTATRGEQHVTPLADPRAADGTPLVPDPTVPPLAP